MMKETDGSVCLLINEEEENMNIKERIAEMAQQAKEGFSVKKLLKGVLKYAAVMAAGFVVFTGLGNKISANRLDKAKEKARQERQIEKATFSAERETMAPMPAEYAGTEAEWYEDTYREEEVTEEVPETSPEQENPATGPSDEPEAEAPETEAPSSAPETTARDVYASEEGAVQDGQPEEFQYDTVIIDYIVDGDTAYAKNYSDFSVEYKYRFVLVDTPESVASEAYLEKSGKDNTIYGKMASDFTKGQLPAGTVVYTTTDTQAIVDDYGRRLVYIWTELPTDVNDPEEVKAKCYNAKLISEGYATVLHIDNDKYLELFTELQEEAIAKRKGLWADKGFRQMMGVEPSDEADAAEAA